MAFGAAVIVSRINSLCPPSRCRARTAGNEVVTLLVCVRHWFCQVNHHQGNASAFNARLGSTLGYKGILDK